MISEIIVGMSAYCLAFGYSTDRAKIECFYNTLDACTEEMHRLNEGYMCFPIENADLPEIEIEE